MWCRKLKGCSQKGPGGALIKDIPGGDTRELPFPLPSGDPTGSGIGHDAGEYDSSGHLQSARLRRVHGNSPLPVQIAQLPDKLSFPARRRFLAFHVAYLDGRKHPAADDAPETTWYGHSIGHWEGDYDGGRHRGTVLRVSRRSSSIPAAMRSAKTCI